MKNILIVLKYEKSIWRFEELIKKLLCQGILVKTYLDTDEIPLLSEALYITDSGRILQKLRGQGMPVLGFSHEKSDSLGGAGYVMEKPEEIDAEYLECVYRRYRHIPWDILETERCYIRETTVADAQEFFALYAEPEVTRYTEGLHPTLEQQEAYHREYIEQMYGYYEFGVWTVLSKETGEVIGRAGFSLREGYELPELGFVIGKEWQHKGIAYEICRAILQYGWEVCEFEQVQVLIMPENTASLNLCRKLGFSQGEKIMEKTEQYVKLTIEKPAS